MAAPKILVIDHNGESGDLLVRSLTRKFPHGTIRLCETSGTAIETTALEKVDAIVVHRAHEQEPTALVRILRKMDPGVVIIGVSALDRTGPFLAAGADNFVQIDGWLMLGTMVASALERRDAGMTPPAPQPEAAWDN